ncbi:hypothetical protein GCK72_002534 [Caenorhabditis remanei]|uniref:Uncharacterized protein n=1 Tax=Caenorhabditis remanei TaxID=31234 RepID=A0A6A5HXJ2_CAERE|nr:hypothetical protein GCK72_002534 [Caenorhabditis remanei]KAF1770712.1 hypothetical protein GCK72_002534 [Caenorhabditis remanei]
MASLINILGLMFSVYFYTWLHPDLNANVRIGLHRFKVDWIIYIGSIFCLFLGVCVIAPKYTRRTNALAGNIGMAVCSVLVVLNHYLLEIKWAWSGLLYMTNIVFYILFMGMAMMGQTGTYYYDRNRIISISIPVVSNIFVTGMLISVIQDTGFADTVPCISFGIHTCMAILAQVCGPRTETWNFFEFLN